MPGTKRVKKPTKRKQPKKKHSDRIVPERKTKVMIKARQHQVLQMYAGGKTPHQIAALLDMRLTDVTRDLRIAVDELVREYAKPTPQQTFVRYAAFQFGIISQLKKAAHQFMKDENKQYNALISSLRAQSDIFDKIMDKGHDYGVITKKKANESIRKQPQDIRQDLRIEITKLTRLLDDIDDSTQSKSLRATQTRITYTVRVRKPLRSEFGIVRASPDWKYRTTVYDAQGNPIPKTALTEEQKLLVAATDIDKRLHQQLADEQSKIIEQERRGAIVHPPSLPIEVKPIDEEEPTEEEEQYLVTPTR